MNDNLRRILGLKYPAKQQGVEEMAKEKEPVSMKSIPLKLDRLVNVLPVNLDKNPTVVMGDAVKEMTMNGGQKVFLLNQEIYRVFFDLEEPILELSDKEGCWFTVDQSILWNRGLHLDLVVYPRLEGILRIGLPRAIQIEKGAMIGTLYYRPLSPK